MKIDVVMLTYGEPQRPSFIDQWKYSNRILYKLTRRVAPIPKFAVPLFGAYRGYMRMKDWKSNEYQSPLEPITHRQAKAVMKELRKMEDEFDWRVHVAYEFRDPSFESFLNNLLKNECDHLILVPMYVPYSSFTGEISLLDITRFQEQHQNVLPKPKYVIFRPCLNDLAHIMANYIRSEVSKRGISDQLSETGLLLGVHGTVITPPKGIKDTGYKDSIELYNHLNALLSKEFKTVDIGWLNHRLGGEWTSPTLEQSAQRMLEEGIQNFVYFPYGFVADNAETQLEGKAVLGDLGIESYHHLDCLNDDPAFIQFLANRIIRCAKTDLKSREEAKAAAA